MAMKLELFIAGIGHQWRNTEDIYTLREDDRVYFQCTELEDDTAPQLFIEDNPIAFNAQYNADNSIVFCSVAGLLFKEYFGSVHAYVQLGTARYEFFIEVLIKKTNARQVEQMIAYLTHKQHDIITICLVQTPHLTKATSDPERILNSVDTFVNTLINCRLELQHHLRKRLIPVKQAAWKSNYCSDIDPFDVIFNLDTLEPALGRADVVVNGRSFVINSTDITTLELSANVEENIILLAGLYSMRRLLNSLSADIEAGFPQHKTTVYDSDYEHLSNVLLRLTSTTMQQRCKTLLISLEEFIGYFKNHLGIDYNQQKDYRPIMTPFVRASRVYRRLFEQLHDWYLLGESSLHSRHCLAKLHSVAKIYEFVALFKLIDYLYKNNWQVIATQWTKNSTFVPSEVIFKRHEFTLTLRYEAKVLPYSPQTQHLDLVDMKHSRFREEYNYWCPDFLLRLDKGDNSVYLILDAKYSSAETVKIHHLPSLLDKYFMNMAVYNAPQQVLTQHAILGVIALFADDNAYPVTMAHWGSYGLHHLPQRLPVILGLPLLAENHTLAYAAFDKLLQLAQRQVMRHS